MIKKILFCFLLTTLLVGMGALAAPAFPHPVYGKITSGGDAVLNVAIEIHNINSGVITGTKTNQEGFFQVDLGNVDPNYRDGDMIKVSLIYCDNLPQCSKTVFVGGGGNEVSFDISTESIPEPTGDDIVIVKHICWDGTAVDDKAKCSIKPVDPVDPVDPVIIVDTVVKIECADGTLVDVAEDCPEKSNSWAYWVIGILCALFCSGAGGWKFYNGKFKHYHRGIKSYHDPSTRHSSAKYRHALWKTNAIGCIRDVKDIQKGIDLSVEGCR